MVFAWDSALGETPDLESSTSQVQNMTLIGFLADILGIHCSRVVTFQKNCDFPEEQAFLGHSVWPLANLSFHLPKLYMSWAGPQTTQGNKSYSVDPLHRGREVLKVIHWHKWGCGVEMGWGSPHRGSHWCELTSGHLSLNPKVTFQCLISQEWSSSWGTN